MVLSLFGASGLSLSAFATGINWQDEDPATGNKDVSTTAAKPKLYIDFLGDSTSVYGSATDTSAPTRMDQSASQSGSRATGAGTWTLYDSNLTPGTVFWVGVGIDKMTLFELAKDNKGLTGLELGFYYNPTYVVPYVGGAVTSSNVTSYAYQNNAAGYKTQIEGANLAAGVGVSSLNQWDSSVYEITQAIPYMAVESDEVTRELVDKDPKTADILTSGTNWEMLYVSLEKKDGADWTGNTNNRFSSGTSDSDIYYVMMLPFVLKAHDASEKICFRLARDASHFSMGGGQYGAGTYASANNSTAAFGAWERETRTPNHNLKEMFDFEGDLNIFTGSNDSDQFYTATLSLRNHQNVNGATLFPTDDPTMFVNQGHNSTTSNTSGVTLSGLAEGRQLTLNVSHTSSYTVGVTVFQTDGTLVSYTEVTAGEQYTFFMPKSNVTVQVDFSINLTDADNYKATLLLADTDNKTENTAVLSGDKKDGTSNSTSLPTVDTIQVAPGNTATVTVETHPDYRPSVSVATKSGNSVTVTAPTTLNSGVGATNVYAFTMPNADVDVTVTYEKWPTHYAELSVFKDNQPGSAGNKAKLSIQDYSTSVSSPSTRSVELDALTGNQHVTLNDIPENREIALEITLASSEYLVTEIRLYNKDTDNGTYSSTYQDLLQTPGLTWNGLVGTLTVPVVMPQNSVEFYVVFGKAQNNDAKLVLVDDTTVIPSDGTSTSSMGTAVMTGDKDGVTGTASAVSNSTNLPTEDTIQVWSGNKVDVVITPYSGYRVRSVVITTSNPLQPTLSWTSTPSPIAPGGTVRFTMPDAAATVTVTFEEAPRDKYNTTLKFVPNNTSAYDWMQSGWPDDPNPPAGTNPILALPTDYGNYAGDLLTAWIEVKPGWHISGLKLIGLDSTPGGSNTGSGATYPILSTSGNGYNNGAGGQVVVKLKQPAEHATLQVELKQGPPTPEPAQGLTLAVNDPDSKAANLARVSIDGAAAQPSAGVNYAYNSGNGYTDSTVIAGQTVDVTWEVETGYYVSDVVVTPASYGVTPTWTATGAQFQQPAGPATVTVYFTKIDPNNPPYTATLHFVNPDTVAGDGGSITNTTHTTTTIPAISPDTVNTDGDTVAAWPGDVFDTAAVFGLGSSNQYVVTDVFQGGSVVPWTSTTGDDGQFVMPNGNVDVYLTFSTSPITGKSLRLTAYDMTSSSSAAGTAGTAKLYFDGTLYGSEAKSNDAAVTVTNVANGRVIKVSAEPKPGYVVDHITYTPSGSVTPVELAAPTGGSGSTAWVGRGVTFTMPANALGVEVYFRAGDPNRYTSNITIWPPNGATVSDVGDAQFVDTTNGNQLGYSVSEPAGTALRVKAYANNGYYIRKITITPASLGIASPITGVFATQTVDFLMPAADTIVNIYYERGWPDSLYANLNVDGPTGIPGNNAKLTDDTNSTSTNMVTAVGSETLTGVAPGDVLKVKINKASGYYVELPIQITDSNGVTIPYAWLASDEITFTMPGTWVNVDVKFKAGTDPSDYKATLHLGGGATGSVSDGSTTKTNDGDDIEHLHPGDTITVTGSVTGTGTVVVMVLRSDDHSVIATVPVTGQNDTYTFVMQEANADVYIAAVSPAGTGDHVAKLIATQDDGNASGGGSATMTDQTTTTAATPDPAVSINAANPSAVNANNGDLMEITATPGTGYTVKSVVVTDDTTGATLPVTLAGVTAGTNPTFTYTYTMPDHPVTAVVTFKKWNPATDSLTAQIVVDNGGNTGNKATLSYAATSTAGATMITNLQPGAQLGVDMTVAPGYKIDLVMVSPTTGGVFTVPLVLPEGQSQSVNFYMPADDVIVFVRFVSDGLHRYNISMDVTDHSTPTPNFNNTATIETAYSGVKGPNKDGDPTVIVQGAPTEVVTIRVNEEPGYYAVVTAVLNDGSNTPVSNLTVDSTGTIFTFSVPSSDVKTEVHFYDSSVSPPNHTVTLHVANSDGSDPTTTIWGDYTNTYVYNANATPAQQTAWANMVLVTTPSYRADMALTNVPYLDTVTVKAQSADASHYIQSAYAVYNGVTLPMITVNDVGTPLTGRDFTFQMQNGDVDVYVVYTDTPPAGPYTVALTVAGPANEPIGAAGQATLKNNVSNAVTDTVKSNEAYSISNPTHVVTAASGDTFTVTVKPNPGYTVDTVVVTPLSLNVLPMSVTQDTTTGEWTYVYPMSNPASNMAVNVTLKASTVTRHTVTLKELTDAYTGSPSPNKAEVVYTIYTLDAVNETMQVPEDQAVTIKVEASAGYYVHHAYAVTAGGAVLKLQNYTPNTVTNLQNLGFTGNLDSAGTAEFIMPKEDVNVYIEFKAISDPPTGDHSAVVTVTSSTNAGLDQGVKLTNTTLNPTETTTATTVGVTSVPPISSNNGNQLVVDWSGSALAAGYGVDTLTITYGDGTSYVYTPSSTDSTYTFTAPDQDVGVIVKLKSAALSSYTATLRIVDHSSAIGNGASMKSGTTIRTADGQSITGLSNGASVVTKATPAANVRVAAVTATDSTGTHILSLNGGQYDYNISGSDVVITVIFDNDNAPTPMYVATVVKTGSTAPTDNTANLANTSNPALPSGSIWTGIYAGNQLRVDVTTDTGYYAVITARKASEAAGTSSIPVLQMGTQGNATSPVVGYLDVPSGLNENIVIEVNYSQTPPTATHTLTLTMADASLSTSNTAAASDSTPSFTIQVDGSTANATANQTGVLGGEALTLTKNITVGYLEKIELISNGITVTLPLATGSFAMPLADATVKLTVKSGTRTYRPHDWVQQLSSNPNPNYVDGYLIGQNLGGNQAHIQVPNLYTDTPAQDTIAAYDEPTISYDYKLYIKDGSNYTLLSHTGTNPDYDIITYNSYDITIGPNVISSSAHTDTGWEFTIRSLKGESALTQLLLNGGVLYITATDTTHNYDESELVEVEIPADPNRGQHKATLRIVDNSGVTGNVAQMSDGTTTVNTNGAVISGLQGNEQIRTIVAPATNARVSAVTVTDSAGTRLLTEVPNASKRYPYFMTGEDIIITVFFEKDNDPLLTRYIATVTKTGAIGVSGNDAAIENSTRNDLSKGAIWAEGHEGNNMKVTVKVAQGYYATIKATRLDNGATVTVTAFGAGPGVTQFDAFLTMPASDVQVTVNYSKQPPANLENDLTLKVVDGNPATVSNQAKLTETSSGTPTLTATTSAAADTANNVPAGTVFDLWIKPDNGYHVKEVKVYIPDSTNPTATQILPIAAHATNTGEFVGSFTMPLDKAEVQVVFEPDNRTGRPYDPDHDPDYNTAYVSGSANPNDLSNPTQLGWVEAVPQAPTAAGNGVVQITLPTLHDDESTTPATALSDAGKATDQPAADYKFYWKDSLGNYHDLTEGTDFDLSGQAQVNDPAYSYSSTAIPAKIGYQFTMTAKVKGGLLDYYIKNGGIIYVTAEDTTNSKTKSDYTQIVIPKTYSATLHYTPTPDATNNINNTAKMYDGVQFNASTAKTADGASITGLKGNETITVDSITPPSGYVLVGVVATTDAGSVNAKKQSATQYTYPMTDPATHEAADVDLTVVYNDASDPLSTKGPHIVTVKKSGDNGLSGNDATVEDLDVAIPASQKGKIWTTAYEGNVVRVNVTAEPGYYVKSITAERRNGSSGTVQVLMYGSYGLLYMPAGCDVDVTVTYDQGTPAPHKLTLVVAGTTSSTTGAEISFPSAVPAIANLSSNGGSQSNSVASVPADTVLRMTTSADTGWSVKSAKLTVDGTSLSVDIPLIDGKALPDFAMPYADATVTVTFQNKTLTARPYEPDHSTTYNSANYPSVLPDRSQTHMEGWILVNTDGSSDNFTIPVRTLYDSLGLHNGDAASYTLYWKDEMGNFQKFTTADVTMTPGILNSATDAEAYEDSGHTKYNGMYLAVSVNHSTSPELWGGYKLMEYLTNGGSIYISATQNPGEESELTEVVLRVVQQTYKATLKFDSTAPGAAEMSDSANTGPVVNTDGGSIDGLDGTETITVENITPPSGYTVVGVVATTKSGSVNAVAGSGGKYTYVMNHADVTMQVVYKKNDDILQSKGPRIVTVYKVDDDGKTANGAAVEDLDVVIPANQKGTIWTAAYVDNVVKVKVTTEPGYYAEITAAQVNGGSGPVEVTTFATYDGSNFTDFYGLFYMPAGCDVDVTVTYKKRTTETYQYDLTLEIKDHDDLTGNTATVTFPDASTLAAAGTSATANPSAAPITNTKSGVLTGTELSLKATVATNYRVADVKMYVGSNTTIDIPLTDLEALPLPVMPFSNAKITVTFENKSQADVQMPRPYDPTRSEKFNGTNYHHKNTPSSDPADESSTHQDGWIKAATTGADSFTVTVPVLHDRFTGTDDLHSAYTNLDVLASSPITDPTYKLYWRDELGNFNPIIADGANPDVQVTLTGLGTYNSYNSAVLDVKVLTSGTPAAPNLWGGYKLLEYLKAGGSIYISAVDPNGILGESEKTEVVIEGAAVKPYDPDNTGSANYKDHWIRAENRGDYLFVEVPLLNNDAGNNATNIDDAKHRLQIFLQTDATKVDSDKNVTDLTAMFNVTDLLKIETVKTFQISGSGEVNIYYDAAWPATGYTPDTYEKVYENDEYWEDTGTSTKYHGARFVITLVAEPQSTDAKYTNNASQFTTDHANWEMLKKIIDNEGTMTTATGATARRLYITADNEPTGTAALSKPGDFKLTDFVDFEVPRYYTWKGILESYAPRHASYFELYVPGATASDPDKLVHKFTIDSRSGRDLWQQDFEFKSSELKSTTAWILRITKPGHVTWKQSLKLDVADDATATDGSELTFTMVERDDNGDVVMDTNDPTKPVTGVIKLFGGDINQDGRVDLFDREMVLRYADDCDYTDDTALTSSNATAWAKSVYNEATSAYAADLDGDRYITILDLAVLMDERNFGMTKDHYTTPIFPWKSTTTNLTMLTAGGVQPLMLTRKATVARTPAQRLTALATGLLDGYTDAELATLTEEDIDALAAQLVERYEAEQAAEAAANSLATAPEVVEAPVLTAPEPTADTTITTSAVEVAMPLFFTEPETSTDTNTVSDEIAESGPVAETAEAAQADDAILTAPAEPIDPAELLAQAREILQGLIDERLADYVPPETEATGEDHPDATYTLDNDTELLTFGEDDEAITIENDDTNGAEDPDAAVVVPETQVRFELKGGEGVNESTLCADDLSAGTESIIMDSDEERNDNVGTLTEPTDSQISTETLEPVMDDTATEQTETIPGPTSGGALEPTGTIEGS